MDSSKLTPDVERHLGVDQPSANCGIQLRSYDTIRSDLAQLVDSAVPKSKIWVRIDLFAIQYMFYIAY